MQSKTPRVRSLNRTFKSKVTSLLIKLIASQSLCINRFDNFWKYFLFTNVRNRSTKTLNLTLSFYLWELLILDNKSFKLPKLKIINNKVPLACLPIYKKVINSTFIFNIIFCKTLYTPYLASYHLYQQYFSLSSAVKLYNNLNFYFLKVYEH